MTFCVENGDWDRVTDESPPFHESRCALAGLSSFLTELFGCHLPISRSVMYAFELSLQYRAAVKARNLDAVLKIFAPDAVISSPLKGVSDVKSYHEWLFSAVKGTTVKVQEAFQALNSDMRIAVHGQYEWVMNDDKVVHFEGMSLFEFTPDKMHITKMMTFYDAGLVRAALAEANSLAPSL